jgi:barstar (barnase inhibitor)
MSPFTYSDDPRTILKTDSVSVAEIGHVSSKEQLLDSIADQLSFPDYFGRNWDALDECIQDLSWLHDADVAVVHWEVPTALGPDGLRTYLAVLRDAAVAWRHRGTRKLLVFFPVSGRQMVEELMTTDDVG